MKKDKKIVPKHIDKDFYTSGEIYSWNGNNYYIVESKNKRGVGVVDEQGKVIIELKYDWLCYFIYRNELYFVAVDIETYLYGVININGDTVIPFIYNDFASWELDLKDEDILFFEKDGKWGAIDINGTTVVDFKYKYFGGIREQYYLVQNFDNTWSYIDKKGNPIKSNNISVV